MNDTKNFSDNVPQNIREKILNLAELSADFIDNMAGDSFGDAVKIESVEYLSRDGFSSSNDGGFSVSQSYSCGYGSGIYHTAQERYFIEGLTSDAEKDFLRENELDEVPDHMKETLWEYIDGYLEECYTIIEVEIILPKNSGAVQVCLLAHYSDAPYMRSKHAEEIFCKKNMGTAYSAA